MSTRTACVVAGATPDEVAAVGSGDDVQMRVNRHGTLVTGKPGARVIDYAAELAGPVYDVMYNPDTGWFAVTIYRQLDPPTRWDNRPGTNAGYPRVDDVLGASTPATILDALDIPATAIGYAEA
jgi:hypothetical protein